MGIPPLHLASPPRSQDNRLTSILDSIIARVVERKIQERQAGGELSPPSPPGPPGPPVSHCILAPSGLLWLHDPGHASNYKLFQEHWRRGQVRTPPPSLGMHGGTADPPPPPPTPALLSPSCPGSPFLFQGYRRGWRGGCGGRNPSVQLGGSRRWRR